MNKLIVIPEPVEVLYAQIRCVCGQTITNIVRTLVPDLPDDRAALVHFPKFVIENFLSDPKLTKKGLDDTFRVIDLRNSLKDLQAGDTWKLKESDYDFLMTAVKEPTNGYNAELVYQLQTFLRALKDAKSDSGSESAS